MMASDLIVCALALLFGAGCLGAGVAIGRAIERDQQDTGRCYEQLARADIGWKRARR